MKRPALPDTALATERRAPMRRGRSRKSHTKGLHAARPDGITAALSHGRTEAEPGGGSASCCLEITPFRGCAERPGPINMRLRLTGRLGRRDVREAHLEGGRQAALSFARRSWA